MNQEKNIFLICGKNIPKVENVFAKYSSTSANHKFNSRKEFGNYYLYKFFKEYNDYLSDIESEQPYVLNYIKRDKHFYKKIIEKYGRVINLENDKKLQEKEIIDKIISEIINLSNKESLNKDLLRELVELADFNGVYYDDTKNRLICCKLGSSSNLKLYIAPKDEEIVISNNKKILSRLVSQDKILEVSQNVIFTVQNKRVNFYRLEDIIKQTETKQKSKFAPNEKSVVETKYSPKHLPSFGYGIYLTDQKYTVNPALGRDEEIRQLTKSLVVPKKGVILVGLPGVGKTEVIKGLSYLIQQGQVCDFLKNKSIFSVQVSSLLSGTKYRGTFEEKVEELCNSLIKTKDVILFVDEIHTCIGAGSCEGKTSDLIDIISPYISENLIKVIGCTTKEGFDRICCDEAFYRRFNVVEVAELKEEVIRNILKQKINNNDFNIQVCLSEKELNIILDKIIKYSTRKQKYINRVMSNPDSSLNILMNCFAYFVISNITCAKYNDFLDGLIDNKNLHLSNCDIYEIETLKDVPNSVIEENKEKVLKLYKKEF